MGNYTIFLANKKFYNKCSENSRSQLVFRTDIFRKLALGIPEFSRNILTFTLHTFVLTQMCLSSSAMLSHAYFGALRGL